MVADRSEDADGLVEREDELALIEAALADAAGGNGSVVVVEGPAGIGKTRLLRAARAMAAERGFQVLRASGGELERDYSYGVVHQLLDRPLTGMSADRRQAVLAGAASLATPLVGFENDAPARPETVDPVFGLVHGLHWLIANLAGEQPLVLELDDAHWADAPSLRFLVYLARRLEGLPVLIVAATRPSEPGAESALVAQLAATERARAVRPGALSARGVAELLHAVYGMLAAPEFADACRDATGGNPFLLHELAAALAAEGIAPVEESAVRVADLGPGAISHAVLMRVGRLSDGATALARAVAVLGGEAGIAEAAALAGLDQKAALTAVEALSAAQVLEPGATLTFTHPIVRSAIYEDIPPLDRGIAHAAAARLLAGAGAEPDRVAAQLVAAPAAGDADVVALLRRAAAGALARGSTDVAARWLARAVAEPPSEADRGDVLAELGAAEQRLGSPDAIDHLRRSIESTADPVVRAERRLVLARALFAAGERDAAVAALDAGIADAEPVDREVALRLEAELSSFGLLDVDVARLASDRLERYDEVDGDTPAERVLLTALATRAWAKCRPAAHAVALARRALGGRRLIREQGADAPPVYQAIFTLLLGDSLDEAADALDAALVDARAGGLVFGFVAASSLRAMLFARRGDVANTESEARAATDATRLHGFVTPLSVAFLIEALIARGELHAAEAVLADSGFGDTFPETAPFLSLLYRRGLLRLAQGRTEEGLADLIEVGVREERLGMASPVTARRCVQGLVHAGAGRRDEGQRLVDEHLELARRWGTASSIGQGLRAQGLLAEGDGVALLEEAAATLEGSPARLDLAETLVDLGAATRRAGRRADAREPLRRGLDLARECGATVLAERAHEELVTAGARPRRRAFTGVASLTASERRVAAMAADGLTNREIAQALFVTVRTVENHLARVYTKLAVHSRAELPAALGES